MKATRVASPKIFPWRTVLQSSRCAGAAHWSYRDSPQDVLVLPFRTAPTAARPLPGNPDSHEMSSRRSWTEVRHSDVAEPGSSMDVQSDQIPYPDPRQPGSSRHRDRPMPIPGRQNEEPRVGSANSRLERYAFDNLRSSARCHPNVCTGISVQERHACLQVKVGGIGVLAGHVDPGTPEERRRCPRTGHIFPLRLSQ